MQIDVDGEQSTNVRAERNRGSGEYGAPPAKKRHAFGSIRRLASPRPAASLAEGWRRSAG